MKTTLLTTLLVFKNTIREELIRSVHVYQVKDGRVKEVEREFVFSESGSYGEMRATPILTLQENFNVSEVSEGFKDGLWLCIFAFHSDHKPQFSSIPPLLLVSRNPKLRAISTLVKDLSMVYKLECKSEDKEVLSDSPGEECQGNSQDCQTTTKGPVFEQDLNCLPEEDDMCEDYTFESPDNKLEDDTLPGSVEKKRRTLSGQVQNLAISDLAKYFDMPIVEASRQLNIGLTVLKKRCREFGIPRWPHRKIKSLDSLIHHLKEEAKHKGLWDKAAAMEKQRMLESEKENIEKKPFMELKKETKRFRQDMFKKRFKARARGKDNSAASATNEKTTTSCKLELS